MGGRITNNGQIRNSNYEFYIHCQGDTVNNGTWTKIWTNLNMGGQVLAKSASAAYRYQVPK